VVTKLAHTRPQDKLEAERILSDAREAAKEVYMHTSMYRWIVAIFTCASFAHNRPILSGIPDRYLFVWIVFGSTESERHLCDTPLYLLMHVQVHARMQESMASALNSEAVKANAILEQMRQRVAESEASDLCLFWS
jgi:hypothetical protein